CLAYFVSRTAPRPVVAWGLFVLAAALFVFSTSRALDRARARRERMRDLQADIARGMTPAEMAAKWSARIYTASGAEGLAERLQMLRQAGQGPYKGSAKRQGD